MKKDTSGDDDLHKQYPKQFKRDQFWEQIKRTVNGRQVSESDIEAIVLQINQTLDLKKPDHLLDLGCGNAALAARLFSNLNRYTGVDFSEYLLGVASEYFRPDGNFNYIESDIRQIDRYSLATIDATKVLIYGCIAYLSKPDVESMLIGIKKRLPGVKRIFVGNIPNLEKAPEFFSAREIETPELDNPQSPIGVWWDINEFKNLGTRIGFQSECHFMPDDFYGRKYRFDILLTAHESPS